MARKLLSLYADSPSWRGTLSDDQVEILGGNLTPPVAHPDDYEVCAPSAATRGVVLASQAIDPPNPADTAIVEGANQSLILTPQNTPTFSLALGAAVPPGQIVPPDVYPVGLELRATISTNVLNPGAGAGSAAFGLMRVVDGIPRAAFTLSFANSAGVIKPRLTFYNLDGGPSFSLDATAPVAIDEITHFVARIGIADVSSSAVPQFSLLRFTDGAGDGVDVAPASAVLVETLTDISYADYEDVLNALELGCNLGVQVNNDAQNYEITMRSLGFCA